MLADEIKAYIDARIAELLSDPPAALVEALIARINAWFAGQMASLTITAPGAAKGPAPKPEG